MRPVRFFLAFGLAAAVGAAAVVPGPTQTSLPIEALPGMMVGMGSPVFQALIVEGAFLDVPTARKARLELDWSPRVFAWGPQAPSPPAAGRDAPVDIEHQSVGCVLAEAYPRIDACLQPAAQVGRAQVLFRSGGSAGPWYEVELRPEGACFSALLPKPKKTLTEFEYFIEVVDRGFLDAHAPATAPDDLYRARVVPREGDCDQGKRMAMFAARLTGPLVVTAVRGSAGAATVPEGFSADGVVSPAGLGVSASLLATGAASGPVMQLQAGNDSAASVRLVVSDGVVLVPLAPGAPPPLAARRKGGVVTESLNGYCLDFLKPPPPPGTPYRVADSALQERFRAVVPLLRAGRRLDAGGRLHPDSEPRAYADSVKQWAVWSRLSGWSEAEFTRAFVDRTRHNVQDLKRPWTKEMDQAVAGAAPGRWRDIRQVVAEADGPRR